VLDHFGEYEAGLLQAGIALFISLNAVLSRANAVYLMPVVHRRNSKAEKMRAAYEFGRKHWLMILLATMPVALFAPWVLVLLYSPAFLALGGALALLVIAQCLQILAGNNYILLMGLDDLGAFGLLSVVGYTAVGALAWVLAPTYGIIGVGVGFVGGFALSYALATWRLMVRHGMRVETRWWYYLAYGLVALGIGGAVSTQLDAWNPAVILAKGAAYLVFAITLLGLLDRDELRELIVLGQRLLFPGGTQQAGRAGASAYRRATQRFFPEAWETTS
jgi:O-antigen/teichoic acid export membrane protein